jgi:hypothetical protein
MYAFHSFTVSLKRTKHMFPADARVDHDFGANNRVFGRYSHNKADTPTR